MKIYKVIARFGLDSELDSIIYSKKEEAIESAKEWLQCNDECDSVEIATEMDDPKYGRFYTIGMDIIEREE